MDYNKIGFKSGLEIHQQLDTSKLFCECPSILRNDLPSFEIKRKLHSVAGESGEVDIAAKFHSNLNKEFFYQGYDSTCLVELDEEPPHKINDEALKIAIQISLLLNCKIIPITQIMRKTVTDGSNTSGFQRTVMIARDGFIETSEGIVKIDSVFLEEDSARLVSKDDKKAVYRLDRLGIPLVEITTCADLKNPKHVKEAALKIGDILRSCKVKRGLGTIRQDLNVSISEANRVEIKGFQDPKLMEKIIDLEILRQKMYLSFKDLKFAKSKIFDVSSIFANSCSWIEEGINNGEKLFAFRLENFKGFLGKRNFSDWRLGKEIAGRIKNRGFKGLIHSDEDLKKYSFSEKNLKELENKLKIKKTDAWIMILGKEGKVIGAIEEIIFPFLNKIKNGNPSEVRNALKDGFSEFLRPMPGAARMYPETDLDLLEIPKSFVDEIKKNLPKLKSEVENDLKKEKLRDDQIKFLLKHNRIFSLYKSLVLNYQNSAIAAKLLLDIPKKLSKSGEDLKKFYEILNEENLSLVLENFVKGDLQVEDFELILGRLFNGKEILEAVKIERVNFDKIKSEIIKLIEEKPGLNPNAYMGILMKKFGGKVSPAEMMKLIKEFLS